MTKPRHFGDILVSVAALSYLEIEMSAGFYTESAPPGKQLFSDAPTTERREPQCSSAVAGIDQRLRI